MKEQPAPPLGPSVGSEGPVSPRPSLARAGLIVAAAMAVGNGLNYGYQVIMSRTLGPSSYGALGALLAVTFILSVPGLAVQTVVARHTAIRDRDGVEVADLWSGTLRALLVVGVALFLIGAAASPIVERFLHLGSVVPALWLAFCLLSMPAVPAIVGMLQGRERFPELAAALLANALAKLVLGAAFVAMGFGVSGALAGAAFGSILGALLGLWWAHPPMIRARVGPTLWRELAAAWFAILGLFLVVNLDIVLARHFLPARESGLYAVGTVVAKVSYWAPRFVIVVIFPRLATSPDRRRILRRGLLAVSGFCLAVVLGVGATSQLLLGGVFGKAYLGLGSRLWLFAGMGSVFALVHLLLFSRIAQGDWRMSKVLAIAVVAKTVLIATVFHHSITQVAAVVLVTGVMLLGMGLLSEYGRPGAEAPTTALLAGEVELGAG